MIVNRVLIPFVCGVFVICAHAHSVSDGYTLWCSDTSLVLQADQGAIAMHFPAARAGLSRDGRYITYRDVFPGIDLAVYRNSVGFEYDWVVAAGVDASAIEVSFTGARSERVTADGDLILGTGSGEVRHGQPFAYQVVDGVRRRVAAAFELSPDGRQRFALGAYDRSRPLVIDPALSFTSGVGGSGGFGIGGPLREDTGAGMAVDSSGNIYVAGLTYSQDFPTVNALLAGGTPGVGCPAVFAAKLSPDGSTILYSTFIAGCSQTAPSIAADASGNVYVAGSIYTGQVGGEITAVNGPSDAFVVKLDTNGALKAAITFGGSGADVATSIALGADGRLYVTGTTTSADFPLTLFTVNTQNPGTEDIFLMKLNPALLAGNQAPSGSVLYSTYLGPGSSSVVTADAAGNAYVAASTTSTAWTATAGAAQPLCSGRTTCADVVALKVSSAGSQFLYTTYLGGSETETIGGIAVDAAGNAYLTGTTDSFDFPTTAGAYITQIGSGTSRAAATAFAVKLNPDAGQLTYSTLLGVGNDLTGTAIAVDAAGDAWVGGSASAQTLPVTNGIQQTLFNGICAMYTPDGSPGGYAACALAGYLAEVNPNGSGLVWATYLGGNVGVKPAAAGISSIVLVAAGNLLAGGSNLAILPTVASPAVSNSASVVKIALGGTSLSNIAVQTAAGFQAGLPLPGGLAALYVSGIPALGTISAPGLPLPFELGGVTVSVDGIAAPLVGVASLNMPMQATQVNFQVPTLLSPSLSSLPQGHFVEVQYAGESGFAAPAPTAPGIFTLPDGSGAIQHAADYSLVTVQDPVVRGETLIIYGTGLGDVATPIASGVGASGPDPVQQGYQRVGTNAGTVSYAGLTPGFPGLYQVNVQVSQDLPSGTNYFYLSNSSCIVGVGSCQGNSVGVYVP